MLNSDQVAQGFIQSVLEGWRSCHLPGPLSSKKLQDVPLPPHSHLTAQLSFVTDTVVCLGAFFGLAGMVRSQHRQHVLHLPGDGELI